MNNNTITNTTAIVTGASENHYKSLRQFLNTVNKKLVVCYVYDLGLSENSKNEMKNMNDIQFRTFDYSKYPSYYNINVNAGQYAWKPALINELTSELLINGHVKYLLWCDAGNKLFDPAVSKIRGFLDKNYIFSSNTSDNILRWTHPLTLKWFSIESENDILKRAPRNGAMMGFNISNPSVIDFIKKFAECASIKECIAPEGSNRENHRQDQSVFSILYYNYVKQHNLNIENNNLDISIHNDID